LRAILYDVFAHDFGNALLLVHGDRCSADRSWRDGAAERGAQGSEGRAGCSGGCSGSGRGSGGCTGWRSGGAAFRRSSAPAAGDR
jgi:hypothetical protein